MKIVDSTHLDEDEGREGSNPEVEVEPEGSVHKQNEASLLELGKEASDDIQTNDPDESIDDRDDEDFDNQGSEPAMCLRVGKAQSSSTTKLSTYEQEVEELRQRNRELLAQVGIEGGAREVDGMVDGTREVQASGETTVDRPRRSRPQPKSTSNKENAEPRRSGRFRYVAL